jgi:hypothetical protein
MLYLGVSEAIESVFAFWDVGRFLQSLVCYAGCHRQSCLEALADLDLKGASAALLPTGTTTHEFMKFLSRYACKRFILPMEFHWFFPAFGCSQSFSCLSERFQTSFSDHIS